MDPGPGRQVYGGGGDGWLMGGWLLGEWEFNVLLCSKPLPSKLKFNTKTKPNHYTRYCKHHISYETQGTVLFSHFRNPEPLFSP